MGDDLSYNEAIAVLRGSLIEASGNARAFAIRSRGRPSLLSARTWEQLAQIEARLARDLEDTLRLELHTEAWTWLARTRAFYRGPRLGLLGEERLVRELYRSAARHPVDLWRAGAPQLEASLWRFFSARTHYLANTLALALNEPAPHPALIWNPGRREVRSR